MMGARELLPVFFSYCRRMLRAFLLVALGGATLFMYDHSVPRAAGAAPIHMLPCRRCGSRVLFFRLCPVLPPACRAAQYCVPVRHQAGSAACTPGYFGERLWRYHCRSGPQPSFCARASPPAKPMRRNIIRWSHSQNPLAAMPSAAGKPGYPWPQRLCPGAVQGRTV